MTRAKFIVFTLFGVFSYGRSTAKVPAWILFLADTANSSGTITQTPGTRSELGKKLFFDPRLFPKRGNICV